MGVSVDGVAWSASSSSLHLFFLETKAALGSKHGACFWLTNAAIVIETRDNEPEPINARTWRARKGLMEVMTSRTWHYHGMDQKAKRTRECVLQKFWQDCISDKNGRRDNIPPNALAVPKTAFSYAITVIDKVEGWNEEKWVWSKFAACMWVNT